MFVISRRDTKNRIVKNAQNAFIGCCEINFFSFQKIFQNIWSPFFQNLTKKNMPTFCNPTRNSLYISSVFTIKNVFKNGLYYDKVHISKSSLTAPCLVSPMLLNVYLNKSKTNEKKSCYRNN